MKPYCEACERNREPILGVLRAAFAGVTRVLEIGSGTGQHAVYFCANLPYLTWQTSDLIEQHAGITAWLEDAHLPNVLPPCVLDVTQASWPSQQYDAVFTSNTLHIVAWQAVERLFAGVARALPLQAVLAVYGPFNYGARYTSAGNARLDQWLKARDPASGIRDFERVDALARSYGFVLETDAAMPANNRTLVWRRLSESAS